MPQLRREGFAAIILAGGRASRMGHADKVTLPVGGLSLLDRAVGSVPNADPVVLVGPQRSVSREVWWTREQPPGGGPLAALAAGVAVLPESISLIAVLAADYPNVTAGTVARLITVIRRNPAADGAVLSDPDGQPQWLIGVWRSGPLRARMPVDVVDQPLKGFLRSMILEHVPAAGAEASDVDTPEELARARDRFIIK